MYGNYPDTLIYNTTHACYVNYVIYMSYVRYMSFVCRLYELYELFLWIIYICLKSLEFVINTIFFCFLNFYFLKKILLIYNDRKCKFSKQKCSEEILKKMWKDQFLKVKNGLLELAKSFIELKINS